MEKEKETSKPISLPAGGAGGFFFKFGCCSIFCSSIPLLQLSISKYIYREKDNTFSPDLAPSL